jgi:hypothetical protein
MNIDNDNRCQVMAIPHMTLWVRQANNVLIAVQFSRKSSNQQTFARI